MKSSKVRWLTGYASMNGSMENGIDIQGSREYNNKKKRNPAGLSQHSRNIDEKITITSQENRIYKMDGFFLFFGQEYKGAPLFWVDIGKKKKP
jgi:hypothetical protein